MLQVDFLEPDQKIAQFVSMRCSSFGKVVSIEIHRLPRPHALVEMASPSEALRVTAQFGGLTFQASARIPLERKPL